MTSLFVAAVVLSNVFAMTDQTERTLRRLMRWVDVTIISAYTTLSLIDWGFALWNPQRIAYPALPASPASNRHWKDNWIIDTGASAHACHDKAAFVWYQPYALPRYATGITDGRIEVLGVGTVQISILIDGETKILELHGTRYMPNISTCNLISGPQLDKEGLIVLFEGGLCSYWYGNGTTAFQGELVRTHYHLDLAD
jgi:hypothetical protein